MQSLSDDYSRIERAILFLEKNFREQPSLGEVAKSVSLSEYHFQRLFRQWAGISPKRFLQFLTVEYAKKLLEESRSVLDTTYEAGLSSPGRLHDLFINVEAVTPGEFKTKGAQLKITYGIHPTPFGPCLLAVTERGICGLAFAGHAEQRNALRDLKRRWEGATFFENPAVTGSIFDRIFPRGKANGQRAVTLFLRGTNFQIKVWQALLKIPSGSVVSYEDIAARIGKPRAVRAVGCAVGQNPVAFVIPCHRVIRKMGVIGEYHWGATRKKAMLAWEAAKRDSDRIQVDSAVEAEDAFGTFDAGRPNARRSMAASY